MKPTPLDEFAKVCDEIPEEPSAREGDLRVWWIPQIPMKPFLVPVPDILAAKLVSGTLADYDRFQFENHVKPDYANVGGIERFEGGEWCEIEESESGE